MKRKIKTDEKSFTAKRTKLENATSDKSSIKKKNDIVPDEKSAQNNLPKKDCSEKTVSKTDKDRGLKIPKRKDVSSNWKHLLRTLPPKKKATQGKSWAKKDKQSKHRSKETQSHPDNQKSSEPGIWFDDVDDILVDTLKREKDSNKETLVKPDSFQGPTKHVAIDCEMVGVGYGGRDSILARVSIVNQYGQCLYDKYVKPMEEVTDYRTHVSGITPKNLSKGIPFKKVQKEVSDILSGRILVGHAIHNDLKVLFLDHPRKSIRDTSRYKPFRQLFQGRNPSLKKLSEKVLGVKVQEGQHDSVIDAQATMRLYTMYRKQWEKDIKTQHRKKGVKTNSDT